MLFRSAVYGMPYGEWKSRFQAPATSEQMQRYEETKPLHARIGGHTKG